MFPMAGNVSMIKSKNWTEEETHCLIAIYGECFQSLDLMSKKKPIYECMSAKLNERGYQRDAGQVTKKIANLRNQYNNERPGVRNGKPTTWPYYAALHKILNKRTSLDVESAQVSEIGLLSEAELGDENSMTSSLDLKCENSAARERANGEGSAMEDEFIVNDSDSEQLPSSSSTTRPRPPPCKKLKVSEELVKICGDSLKFMKEEAKKRNKQRDEIRETNLQLLQILGRIATSAEMMAASTNSPCQD